MADTGTVLSGQTENMLAQEAAYKQQAKKVSDIFDEYMEVQNKINGNGIKTTWMEDLTSNLSGFIQNTVAEATHNIKTAADALGSQAEDIEAYDKEQAVK